MNSQPIDYYQGNSFAQPSQQQQQQQQTPTQPIRLANPTQYHIAQTQRRKNQNKNSNDGAPPTPNNSFQTSSFPNTFSSNTIDPQILTMSRLQQHYNMNPIKHESSLENIDIDFDNATVLSPQTNSSGGSPTNHNFETEDFGRSFKPASHLESLSSFGGSPFSPGIDNADFPPYLNEEFSPMSAPTTSPLDVKTSITNNPKMFRNPHNSLGGQITSMSLPVQLSTGAESWYGTSLDGSTSYQPGSSSLQYTPNDIISSGYMDDDTESQKQAMIFEKRRRRRESHNAVERRRRDNINEKIQELSTLLPDLYVDSANKPNKGVILRKSVDYIRHLKSMVEQERNRNSKLETQVRELSQSGPGTE